MSRLLARIWKIHDVEAVKKHLMVLGDSLADCGSCKELGLDPWKTKQCPACKTDFQYIASRRLVAHPGERFGVVRRIMEGRPDLIIMDYDDFQKAVEQQKAKDFFSQ